MAFGVLAVPGAGLGLAYSSPLTYSAGTNPKAIVAANFNGDGKTDLAVANAGSGDVSILLGNGDGTFRTATSVAAGPAPTAIATADLNGDTFADLVVPNSTSNTALVLLGNGDGTFQPGVAYLTAPNPTSVALGDFSSDGIIDIATNGSAGSQSSRATAMGPSACRSERPRSPARGCWPREISMPTGSSISPLPTPTRLQAPFSSGTASATFRRRSGTRRDGRLPSRWRT